MATAAEIQAKMDELSGNMDKLDTIVNGGENATVTTDGGVVPSVANFYEQMESLNDATVSQTRAARDEAVAARDAALVGASGVYATTAAGITATTSGDFFVVANNAGWQLYENVSTTATSRSGVFPSLSAIGPSIAQAIPWLNVVEDGAGGHVVPAFDWDIPNGRVWLNGSTRTVAGALTDNGDGTHDVNGLAALLTSGVTMFLDYTTDGHTGTPSGSFMGMIASKTNLAGEVSLGTYNYSPSDTLGVNFNNRMGTTVSALQGTGWGANRAAIAVPASGNQLRKLEGQPTVTGIATGTYVTPIQVTIGGSARTGRDPLTNASVRRATVFPVALSSAQLDTLFETTHPDYGLEQSFVPHWVPRVPHESLPGYRYADLAYDYSRGRCWFNGRQKSFADVFVDAAGGDFTLIKPPRGLTASTGITFGADVHRLDFYQETEVPSGFVFNALRATEPAAEALEFTVKTQNIPGTGGSPVEPGGIAETVGYVAKVGQFFPLSSAVSANGSFLSRGQGIYRYCMSVPPSGPILTFNNSGPVKSNASTSVYVPQDWMRFGARVAGTDPLANTDIVQGFIFCKSLSVAQMNALKTFNEYGAKPLLFIGDSINNGQQPAEMLGLHLVNDGFSYVPWWSQGQGGRGIHYFEGFIEELVTFDDSFRDHILVMVEGGFDYEGLNFDGSWLSAPLTEREIQGHLREIRYKFREPRWVWMESNFNRAAELDIAAGNTEMMDQLRVTMANIRETYPAAYCYTNALIQAQAETNAEYDAIRVDGRCATHLRGDGIHGPWGLDYSGDPADESWYYWWSRALQHHLAGINYPPMVG